MRKLQKLFLIPLLLLCFAAHAQTRTVKGKVLSEKDNLPVSGASVFIKGKATGTTTGGDGSFSLSVPAGNVTLVISYIGFTSVEQLVEGNLSEITVSLAASSGDLGEVVVTALGISRKAKTLVYATQTVKTSELTEARDPNNVINSLQGKVANAVINQGSGGPGSGVKIVLRLQGSPLFQKGFLLPVAQQK